MSTVQQAFEVWKEINKANRECILQEEEDAARELYKLLIQACPESKEAYALAIYHEMEGNLYRKAWFYSFVITLFPKAEWVKELLIMLIETDELKWDILYFLYEQILCKIFRESKLETKENIYFLWKLLDKIYQKCKEEISVPLQRIPREDRDENMSIVIIEQFLSEEHGPTKTALDRCYVLKTVLGKKVFLINTAELMTISVSIPFFGSLGGTYFPELTETTMQYWKNNAIPYFQCDNDMPNIRMMEMLLQTILQLKPGIVVCVGGGSLFAGLVNELVPVLTVGTTTSGIVATLADYQVVNKQFIIENENLIKRVGRTTTHMIPGNFTFSLKKQTEVVTRLELGIPEQAFVIGVVGSRLDVEITAELISLFEKIVGDNIVIYLIGYYSNYQKMIETHPLLEKKVYYRGFSKDILSRIELCDLYLNPLRKGGGTSAIEAMSKAKPVVTISYGDVAGIVGESFCCKDYTEMEQQIMHYRTNREYYENQSLKAREIAEVYLDTEQEFKRIIDEYLLQEEN